MTLTLDWLTWFSVWPSLVNYNTGANNYAVQADGHHYETIIAFFRKGSMYTSWWKITRGKIRVLTETQLHLPFHFSELETKRLLTNEAQFCGLTTTKLMGVILYNNFLLTIHVSIISGKLLCIQRYAIYRHLSKWQSYSATLLDSRTSVVRLHQWTLWSASTLCSQRLMPSWISTRSLR